MKEIIQKQVFNILSTSSMGEGASLASKCLIDQVAATICRGVFEGRGASHIAKDVQHEIGKHHPSSPLAKPEQLNVVQQNLVEGVSKHLSKAQGLLQLHPQKPSCIQFYAHKPNIQLHPQNLKPTHLLALLHSLHNLHQQNISPSVDPSVVPGTQPGMMEYDALQGQLFVNGVSEDDVKQGALGDCYFMAALSSVAADNPEVIQNMIKPLGNNQYQVTFYKDGKKVNIVVDSDIPQNHSSNDPLYGESTQKKELWVSLVEKAYAVFSSSSSAPSYASLDNGGNPADALYAITGVKAKTTNLTSYTGSHDALYNQIYQALKQDKPIVASSNTSLPNGTGLVAQHAYSVVGIYTNEDGKQYVVLRNPWGTHEWTGQGSDGVNDGSFDIPIEDFMKYFRKISTGGTQCTSINCRGTN